MVTNQLQYSYPRISNITTDSREADETACFCPQGDKFDGHDFVKQAKFKNAIGLLLIQTKLMWN